MELNKEQIKRVFECCISSKNVTDCISNECPLWSPCDDEGCADDVAFARMGLQIYKELTEENKRLEEWLEDNLIKQSAENVMLIVENERLSQSLANVSQSLANSKADTVRKMQAEIEARCIKGGIYPAFVKSTIDKIAEEMLSNGS